MQGKFLGFLAIALVCLVGYALLTERRMGPPTSAKVNDEAFYLLKPQMPFHEVVDIQGEPQESTTGSIVKINQESPSWHSLVEYGLQEERHSVDRLSLFRGVNDESVRALFSSGKLVAAEYRLGNTRVLYVGPPAQQSERTVAFASIRPSDELLQRIDAFRRRQSLREQKFPEAKRVAVRAVPPRPTPKPPPEEDDDLAVPPRATDKRPPDLRAWTSADGAHRTEAKFVGASGGVARLQKKDGSVVDVPKSKLCPDDWIWIREHRRNFVSVDFKSLLLPSGAALRSDSIEPRPGWQDNLLSASSFVGYFGGQKMGDSGQAIAVIANRRGEKLDGPAVSFYEDGHLKTLADYRADQLCGALRIWDENKNRLLYSEYSHGKRHGITCLFSDGLPWIVQEYQRGATATEYYVDLKGGVAKLVAKDAIAVHDEELDYADALEKLADLDGVLQKGEMTLRRAVQDQIKSMVAGVRARQREGANARLMGRQAQIDADWSANAAAALSSSGF